MIDPDGYRPNVGIVLMHPDGRVFWARRVHRDGWQFPQGGMNSDETPLEAMLRLCCLGDCASFLVSIITGRDPTPVTSIDKLKAELAR